MLSCFLKKVYYTDSTYSVYKDKLRCFATNRKVAGSIPADVIGIFL